MDTLGRYRYANSNMPPAQTLPIAQSAGPIVEYYPDHCCVLLGTDAIVELTYARLEALHALAERIAASAARPFVQIFEELAAAEHRACAGG
ncbi:MAG: hypothetical protein AAF674_20340 [Pseudomonadota bacterium]